PRNATLSFVADRITSAPSERQTLFWTPRDYIRITFVIGLHCCGSRGEQDTLRGTGCGSRSGSFFSTRLGRSEAPLGYVPPHRRGKCSRVGGCLNHVLPKRRRRAG